MDSWRAGAARHALHTLTGVYAVGALDESDAAAFEEHLRECPPCAQEVRELADTGARLAAAVAVEPSPELAAAVLTRIGVTRQDPPRLPEDTSNRIRGGNRFFRPWKRIS